jgi:transcriptional regulator with PAS, ATPase and Fis domain
MTLANISLAQIMDSMAEGLFVLDADHRIVLWNRAMETLTGYSALEAMGKDCTLLDCAAPVCPLSESQDMDQVECQLRHKDGSRVPVLKNGRVLKDNAGNTIGVVETVTDLRPIRRLEAQVSEARSQGRLQGLGKLKGKSHAMQTVYERIGLAAQSEATILVLGETGTGKELAAQAIHTESARQQGPLVKVNCSALSEGLLESELFGHVKGAFTGAIQDKVGRFEAAHGGTIFLDEIGDISPLIQLKLLRVIQERTLEPVGSSETRKVDVRVIAATHRDLKDLVRRDRFREDLFYRLHVFQIEMPPLRTRKEDIPLLIQSFMVRFNQDTGKTIESLSDEVLHCLMDYCWPGNVRELENAIEHAYVTCAGPQIGLFDLPVALRQTELRRAECDQRSVAGPATSSSSQPRVLTRDALIRTLEQCQWNKAEASRQLGINRATVWRKMKQWDISMQQ